MKTAQHTQGNWHVLTGNYTHYATVNADVMNRICAIDLGGGHAPIDEALANAKLIAAAPKLLDALLTLKSNFDANTNFGTLPNKQELEAGLNIINEAINQATTTK